MTSTRRALGLSLAVLSLSLSVVLNQLLPLTADPVDRFVVAIALPFPLLVGGVFLLESPDVLGRGGAQRLLLVGVATALLGARKTAHLFGVELSSTQEWVYLVMTLVLLSAMVWSWRRAPFGTSAGEMSSNDRP